jgi:hypothetical protein
MSALWLCAYACPRDEILPPRQPCFSRDDCDRKAFDESGTRPAHPEDPGNLSG